MIGVISGIVGLGEGFTVGESLAVGLGLAGRVGEELGLDERVGVGLEVTEFRENVIVP